MLGLNPLYIVETLQIGVMAWYRYGTSWGGLNPLYIVETLQILTPCGGMGS